MVESLVVPRDLSEQELAKLEKPKLPFQVDFENGVIEVEQLFGEPTKVQFEINAEERKITLHLAPEERPKEFSFSGESRKDREAAKKSVMRELLLLTAPYTSLPNNDWSILSDYFGLPDGKDKTANEIADRLGFKHYTVVTGIINDSLRDLGLQDFYHKVVELAGKRVTRKTVEPLHYKDDTDQPRVYGDESDKELVRSAQQGSETAAKSLYERYFNLIYRFILARTGSEQEAEDLTQTVLSRSLTKLSSYRERENIPFSRWLYRIARNAIISSHRRKEREPKFVSFDAELVIQTRWGPRVFPENELLLEEVWQAIATGVFADPAEVVENRLMGAAVCQAMEHLTKKQKRVITLRFVEGLPVKKTAQILGTSEVSVKVTQHQALARLRNILRPPTDI